ncbi:MAG: GNAT family N-acetyltransferase [Paracoccaceae bacterium]
MIRLARLATGDSARLLHLELGRGQADFVHPIADMVAERKAGVNFHVISRGDETVGFFKIDFGQAEPESFVQQNEASLRGFLVGAQFQGQGVARAAMAQFADHMRLQYPHARSVVLCVHVRNPAARHTYLGGGFIDTGENYPGGRGGPQNILRLQLGG